MSDEEVSELELIRSASTSRILGLASLAVTVAVRVGRGPVGRRAPDSAGSTSSPIGRAPLSHSPYRTSRSTVDVGLALLLAGEQPITPTMAAKLGAYFGVPARWWLLMQAEYDAVNVAARPELVR